MGSLFDDAGIGVQTGPPVCPSCQSQMMPTSVICVNCGFNRHTGMRMQGAGGPVAEEDHAEALVAKARKEIEATPISKAGSDFGDISSIGAWIMPLFLPFFFCVSFALVLYWGWLLTPQFNAAKEKVWDNNEPQWLIPIAFYIASISLFGLGWFFNSLAALDKHPVHGLISLFTLGLYSTIFGYMYFEKCRKGMLCVFIGTYLGSLGSVSAQTINLSTQLSDLSKSGELQKRADATGDPETVALANAVSRMYWYIPQMWVAHVLWAITWICAVVLTLRAFDDDWLHGFIALFTGLYAFIYGFIHFRTCAVPSIIGVVAMFFLFFNFLGMVLWNISAIYALYPSSVIPPEEKLPGAAQIERPAPPLARREIFRSSTTAHFAAEPTAAEPTAAARAIATAAARG